MQTQPNNPNPHLKLDELLYSPLAQLSEKDSSEYYGFELSNRQVMYIQTRRNELAMQLLQVQVSSTAESQAEDLQKRAATAGQLKALEELLYAAQTFREEDD